MKVLEVSYLTFSYKKEEILSNIDFVVNKGEIFGIIGPNGSGKSTLLKSLSNILPLKSASIRLLGRDISKYGRKELAANLAVLPQSTEIGFDFSVRDIVEMGRYPHFNSLQGMRAKDKEVVERALVETDTLKLEDKSIKSISGGERQRVLLARCLAQEPQVILLDEPTSALDVNYQLEIFEILVEEAKKGITIVVILHDLNLASQYCDRLLLLNDGKINTIAHPKEVIQSKRLKEVYGCNLQIDNSQARPYVKILRK